MENSLLLKNFHIVKLKDSKFLNFVMLGRLYVEIIAYVNRIILCITGTEYGYFVCYRKVLTKLLCRDCVKLQIWCKEVCVHFRKLTLGRLKWILECSIYVTVN